MFGAIVLLLDGQRAPIKPLGLIKARRALKEQAEVAKHGCNAWMIGPQTFFLDGQRPSIERFGLLNLIAASKQIGQIAKVGRYVWMLRSIAALIDS
jgi:hypothetical protein